MKCGREAETKVFNYNKGGHMRMSTGGTVYERQMDGEEPTHKFHHYDYEAQMRGEYPVHKADHSMKRDMHMKHMKLAAGGVAKMRHEEATSSGMPIHKRNSVTKVF